MSDYKPWEIEPKWRKYWREHKTYKAVEDHEKDKFYVLDMFPYPSGAGLHVGHPLGYIASDIYARYKRHKGFNVLHPMGYDSFGLPAEQYAIQTGQHPAITTTQNIERYREQLDKIGFSFDWDREVRTSDPSYYRWTQWIFKEIYRSWYNLETNRAEPISELISRFEHEGNLNVNAFGDEVEVFDAKTWNGYSNKEKESVLMAYRLVYLADSWVNWCPALGTVLANDEIKDGVSERGGHPVEQKLMRQWSMRITAYAQRLLDGLDQIDFSESLKEQQRNWIGKSNGATVKFNLDGHDRFVEVFTTRPDTIFGVSFMVLAPENELVDIITTSDYKGAIADYKKRAAAKSERDRQANVKEISGQFTGAFVIHPFTGDKIPVWIGDYVLAGYGTGAVMAVPAGDQRDYDFAKFFQLPIPEILEGVDISQEANPTKDAIFKNSQFLNGLNGHKAIIRAIEEIEKAGIGEGKVNFRLRDAIFSRQRYWGEPFPVFYKDDVPYLLGDDQVVTLPEVDKYLPTEDGEPPLARAKREAWNIFEGDRMELNTMPGWAGSSWYFLRYMDPLNVKEFAAREKVDYWNQVDLYIGGAEHATGHLLYARFWCKFLFDRGYIGFEEPFKKLINQGMILGKSSFVYRVKDQNKFVSFGLRKQYETARLHADIALIDGDKLDIEAFKKWRPEFKDFEFELEDGVYKCGSEVEKMSKSKYNVQTPDELVDKFGADTLRCYEMFLGPLEQFKPWDVQGINGVNNFLKKLWRLFYQDGKSVFNEDSPSPEALKILHRTIKRVDEDLNRFSFNTVVSTLMIAVNELQDIKCYNKQILSELLVLLSPYAPHVSEELWQHLGGATSVTLQPWPKFEEKFIVESSFAYPVSFNGKVRFKIDLPVEFSKEEVEKEVLAHEKTSGYLEGKDPKKIIVVPKRIVNVVV